MQRLELLKVADDGRRTRSIERRWEWMRAVRSSTARSPAPTRTATTVLVDFQRDAGHTEVLTAATASASPACRSWTSSRPSVDTMNDAEFGGLPVQVEMGGGVWAVMRKDAEILANLDKYRPVGGVEHRARRRDLG
jgi:hypothetical protein